MNKQNIITYSIFIIFIILFSYFYGYQYIDFHKEKWEIEKNNENILELANDFIISDLDIVDATKLYYTPDKKLLDKIITEISKAEKYIYLEVYMLTEKRIQTALKNAYLNGIEVKIILEKDPYMAYSINDKAFNNLKKAGIDIVWSNTDNYSYNHSKILLIDDLAIISTGNMSYSTFTKNRDFFIFTYDKKILTKLKELFFIDYKGNNTGIYNTNLLLSPIYSRSKIEKLLKSAKDDIKIYIQYFKDEKINDLLIKIKKEKNIKITAIIPKTAEDDKQTKQLIKAGIDINIIPKYKMHAKGILVDGSILFIGSVNFSKYSFDQNREVGILLENKNVISTFLEVFLNDLKE